MEAANPHADRVSAEAILPELTIKPLRTPGLGAADVPVDLRAVGSRGEVARPRLRSIVRRDALYRRTLALSDAVAVAAGIAAAAGVSGATLTWAAALMAAGFVLLGKLLGLYDRDESRLHKETLGEIPLLFGLCTTAALVLYLGEGLFVNGEIAQTGVLVIWATVFGCALAGRMATRSTLARMADPERCLVVGDRVTARMLSRKFGFQGINAEVVAALRDDRPASPVATMIERVRAIATERDVDRVILASGHWRPDDIVHTIDELKASGVKVSVLPPISRLATLSFEIDQLPGIALLGMRGFQISRSSRFVKRCFDVVSASLALIVLALPMIALAIAIKLDSRGPVLFRQRRIGRHGEPFDVFKFRSMVEGADRCKSEFVELNEADENGFFKIPDDPRITRVGDVIRKWNLDELPQLFNVLGGEMSLVGPRPLIPEEDEMVRGAYRRRLDIAPGMTGHWQILGSWRVPLDEMMTLDYLYVANWSLWRDVKLLAQTVPYVLRRNGI